MGKKKSKKWSEKRANKKVKPNEEYVLQKFITENFIFDLYYYAQFKGHYFTTDEEFRRFRWILNQKLPIVFRDNRTVPNYEKFVEKVAGQEFLERFAKEIKEKQEEEEKKGSSDTKKENLDLQSLAIKEISWFPLVYQFNMDRQQLKRSNVMESLHKYIQKASESGLISRQELVSMIPPLLLDLKADDLVLDMCAAPGSKTSQMLESMYNDHINSKSDSVWKGAVIANELDYTRAYMLTHQVQRMNSSAMIIVNHAAQFFPALYLNTIEEAEKLGKFDSRFHFDKILADVPCSGDGAIRKLPQVWPRWSTRDGMGLHRLQTQIVSRGLHLLKDGGILLYSTCSLNPIEDEAVVTQIFRESNPGSIELIDIHEIMSTRNKMGPGLIAHRGLTTWQVMEEITHAKEFYKEKSEHVPDFSQMEKFFRFYKDKSERRDSKTAIRDSMFPEDEKTMKEVFRIQNCMRILPNDQNSGGFFLALFKKNGPVKGSGKSGDIKEAKAMDVEAEPNPVQAEEEEEKKEEIVEEKEIEEIKSLVVQDFEEEQIKLPDAEAKKMGKNPEKYRPVFLPITEEDFVWLRDYFGLHPEVTKELLIQQAEGERKILFISPGVRRFLDSDKRVLVHKINMGVKAFYRNKEGYSDCRFRICQDAVSVLLPYISKRIVEADLATFKYFLQTKNIKHEDISNEGIRKSLIELSQGCFVLAVSINGVRDSLVCHNFKASVSIMCPKEFLESFNIRYIF